MYKIQIIKDFSFTNYQRRFKKRLILSSLERVRNVVNHVTIASLINTTRVRSILYNVRLRLRLTNKDSTS